MKQVTVGNLAFSKVVCGTKAFWRHSHLMVGDDAYEFWIRIGPETEVGGEMKEQAFADGLGS